MTLGKLKLAVYLLLASISIILGILSLSVFAAYSNVHDVLLNLSTELAGTVLLFFVLETLFELSSPARTETNLSEAGLRGCYERCPLNDMLSDLAKSSREILILQTWISNDRQIQDSLTQAIHNEAKVKILLLNPDSPLAEFRNLECNFGAANVVSDRIKVALTSFYRFKKLKPVNDSSMEIRQYLGTPVFALFVADDNVYFMPYFRGTTSYQSPCFKASRKKETYLLNMLIEHFYRIWDQSPTYGSDEKT